jgi:N-acetylmuramic acid 6-phosphate etherase
MSSFQKITESSSNYRHLEKMTVNEILTNINQEDAKVHDAVSKVIPSISLLVEAIVDKLLAGGRLFYLGAGTSGRIAVVDASECPPTYGVPEGLVVGIIAGGNDAMFHAVEFAEDDSDQAWKDLSKHAISNKDVVIGIAASGTTPYVIGGLRTCKEKGIVTGSICCNPCAPLSNASDFPIEVLVGPEFVTGSTRMKSGTAQKLVLNMISTAVMIKLGRVEDNKMVNMQLTNEKLFDRGVKMIMEKNPSVSFDEAKSLLLKFGSVKLVLEQIK